MVGSGRSGRDPLRIATPQQESRKLPRRSRKTWPRPLMAQIVMDSVDDVDCIYIEAEDHQRLIRCGTVFMFE